LPTISKLNKTEAGRALDSLIKTIENTLKNGEPVTLVGFAVLKSRNEPNEKVATRKQGKKLPLQQREYRALNPVKP